MCTRASHYCVHVLHLSIYMCMCVQTVFFFPAGHWIRALYGQPDLPRLMREPADMQPPGSVKRSRGWRLKMVQDPLMAASDRNVGAIGSTDGVPFFADQQRGGWPFTYQSGSLPSALAQSPLNMHLAALAPSEFLTLTGVRKIKSPTSLNAVLTLCVYDLVALYYEGVWVVDASLPENHPRRRVLVLPRRKACFLHTLVHYILLFGALCLVV
jgi:hypothetical protein